jgi:hypothetical protein
MASFNMRLDIARIMAEEKRYCAWKYPNTGRDPCIHFSRMMECECRAA